jgi:surfactin family lipopeptide synthetase A
LLRRLHLNRDLSGSPLVQTMLGLLNTPSITKSSNGLWSSDSPGSNGSAKTDLPSTEVGTHTLDGNNGTTKFDLSISLVEDNQVYRGTTEYNTDLFDHQTIACLLQRFQTLLESAADNPEQRISELPLMTQAERRQLLAYSVGPTVALPEELCIHQLFEAQAERTPEAIALEVNGKRLTYAVLNSRANQWARFLQKLGAGPEVMVGIYLDRSPEMVLAKLATLKAGAAYVPLDPTYPNQRLSFMLQDAQVSILLTTQRLLPSLPQHSASTICMDTQSEQIAAEGSNNVICRASGGGQVCVLYTSGSTGRPKGVMITHRALVNYALSAVKEYGLVRGDRVLQFASMSFDAALEEIYPCLLQGATLVLRTDEMLDSIPAFLTTCTQMEITLIILPTAYWHEIVSQLQIGKSVMPPNLRLLIIGGERALPEKLLPWQKVIGSRVALVNTYGPTEGTIAVTRYKLPGIAVEQSSGREVPIGYPIENASVYLLDRWMQPVAVGIPGELYIGGEALSRGYLHRPDLTAETFVPDPFSANAGDRLYRTGDLVRFLSAGNLEYRGRTDHQVKIRGFRIEPGEIESLLEQHEAVKDAVVLAREDDPGLKRLVAYIVARGESSPKVDSLRGFLKQHLPEYMVPSVFLFLQKLPLNSSGKIDYRALPKPDQSRADFEGELVGPRTPTEEVLMSIWAEILRLERIGVHENFFDLGGHSLLATQVISRIDDAFHIDMPLRRLFEQQTIAELSVAVEELAQKGTLEKVHIVSARGLINEQIPTESIQVANKTSDVVLQKELAAMSVPDPSMGQMLAGLEGLSEQEIYALLGEEDKN